MTPRFLDQIVIIDKLLVIFTLIITISGCGTVEFKSTPPEAQVLISIPGKTEPKNLGKTPFKESIGNLINYVNQGTVVITLEKPGFQNQTYIVPNLGYGNLGIEATLVPAINSSYKEFNTIINLAFRAERFVHEQRLGEATEAAKKIIQINENVAVAYQLLGTIYFLQKNFKDSRFQWLRSLELDPENAEAQKMLSLIEKKL